MRAAILLCLMPSLACAQAPSVKRINELVAKIDEDRTLSVDTVDAFTVYNMHFDGGGEVLYWYRGKELVRVRQEVGLSWGRSTMEYYFHNDTIMLLREREELFPMATDSSDLDHSHFVTSYEGTRCLWTWRNELQVIERGSPGWAGPPDEAEINLHRLLLFRRRE